jgi:23S rRNA (guanosine2251-2'-O)-methyltransferase
MEDPQRPEGEKPKGNSDNASPQGGKPVMRYLKNRSSSQNSTPNTDSGQSPGGDSRPLRSQAREDLARIERKPASRGGSDNRPDRGFRPDSSSRPSRAPRSDSRSSSSSSWSDRAPRSDRSPRPDRGSFPDRSSHPQRPERPYRPDDQRQSFRRGPDDRPTYQPPFNTGDSARSSGPKRERDRDRDNDRSRDFEQIDLPVGEFHVLAGVHAVVEAMKAGRTIEKLLVDKMMPSNERLAELYDQARRSRIPVQKVPGPALDRHAKRHQGVVAFVAPFDYIRLSEALAKVREQEIEPFMLLLDHVTDVRNAAALARSAEGAGVQCFVVPMLGTAMLSEMAYKASSGALEHMYVCREPGLDKTVAFLQKEGIKVVAITEKANKDIFYADLTGPIALVVGSEEDGISSDVLHACDLSVRLPMQGQLGSLNVGAAGAVALFEVVRQRMQGMPLTALEGSQAETKPAKLKKVRGVIDYVQPESESTSVEELAEIPIVDSFEKLEILETETAPTPLAEKKKRATKKTPVEGQEETSLESTTDLSLIDPGSVAAVISSKPIGSDLAISPPTKKKKAAPKKAEEAQSEESQAVEPEVLLSAKKSKTKAKKESAE